MKDAPPENLFILADARYLPAVPVARTRFQSCAYRRSDHRYRV